MWTSNHCPSCHTAIENTNHVLYCPESSCIKHLSMKIAKIGGTLISKKVPPPTTAMMLEVLFPTQYPLNASIQLSNMLLCSQNVIREQKWGLP